MAWQIHQGAVFITAVFEGHLSAEEGRDSAHAFAESLRTRETAFVIFDVAEMTGYDTAARVAWQKALFPHRRKIASIEVRGGNMIILMGASVLALALGVPLVKS